MANKDITFKGVCILNFFSKIIGKYSMILGFCLRTVSFEFDSTLGMYAQADVSGVVQLESKQ